MNKETIWDAVKNLDIAICSLKQAQNDATHLESFLLYKVCKKMQKCSDDLHTISKDNDLDLKEASMTKLKYTRLRREDEKVMICTIEGGTVTDLCVADPSNVYGSFSIACDNAKTLGHQNTYEELEFGGFLWCDQDDFGKIPWYKEKYE